MSNLEKWLKKEKEREQSGQVIEVKPPQPPLLKKAEGGGLNREGDRILTMSDIPPILKKICPTSQIAAIMGSEEHFDIVARLAADAEALKKARSNSDPDPVCYLHYFDNGASDWYVFGWRGSDLMTAFVCLNGDSEMAESGDISLEEMFSLTQKIRTQGSVSRAFSVPAIQLDFFWTPKPLSVVENFVNGGERVPSGPIHTDKPISPPPIAEAAPLVDRLKTAEEFGKQAFLSDRKRVPAKDSGLMSLLEGKKVDDTESVPLLKAWLAGYDIADILAPLDDAEEAQQDEIKLKNWEKRMAFIERIEALIDANGLNRNRYSAQDLADMRLYDGWGGLAKNLRGSNKFKTTEILEEFYTPYETIEKMWGLAYLYGFDAAKENDILEPACGIGKMLEYVPPNQRVDAFEISKYSYTICKLTLPEYFNFTKASFETLFFRGNMRLGLAAVHKRYDLIMSNPPFSGYISPFAQIKGVDGETEAKETGAKTFDQYFLMRGIDLLKQGGLLLYVMPATFMNNEDGYNDFKEVLLSKATLLDAYRLPTNHPHTAIGWDLLVFKKL